MDLSKLIPKHLPRDGGEWKQAFIERSRALMVAQETGGLFTLMEIETPPGVGPPLHVHTKEDEAFYVLDGTVEVTVDGTPYRLGPGDFAYGPRNIPHRFQNVGDAPSRMLVLMTPGGLEGFFAEVTERMAGRPPDLSLIGDITAKYGISLIG